MYQTDVAYYLDQVLDDSISKETCLDFIAKYKVKYVVDNKEIKIDWNLVELDYLKELIKNLIDSDTNIIYSKVYYNKEEGVQNEIC